MRAAERGIWKSAEMRRRLAAEGLEISAGKMSSWWAGTPPTIRLDELDVICVVLECTPSDLMVPEPEKVAELRTLLKVWRKDVYARMMVPNPDYVPKKRP